MQRIYLDYAATTPMDERVLASMMPFFKEQFYNPSSLYAGAREVRMQIDKAREIVAEAMGALPGEIIFTSSGTESANLAVIGSALANRDTLRHKILFGASEHHCVLETKPLLESLGFSVDLLPIERDCSVSLESCKQWIKNDVLLVCVMHANNETGIIQPIELIAGMCKNVGALFACDIVQSFGTLPFSVKEIPVDFAWISAHKFFGPKGIGALYSRGGSKPQPIIMGGGQEREMRAGTEFVSGIIGLAEAVKIHLQENTSQKVKELRDIFRAEIEEQFLLNHLPNPVWTAQCDEDDRRAWENVLPGHAHFRVPGADAESVLINLDRYGVDASSGSACSSGSIEPSHVLLAMGLSEKEAKEGLRFTIGKHNTREEMKRSAMFVVQSVKEVLQAKGQL